VVRGFGAGATYPQIWLRDSATLVPLTRYFYPREYLTSWLEEHLSHQARSGSLYDWVAAGEVGHFSTWAPEARQIYRAGPIVLSADKNTTEADQEASAVLAAAAVFDLWGDPGWLEKRLLNRSILSHLDDALEYVLTERVHRVGLVTSAFTADWGDVSPVHGDQRAIYIDEATPMVVGLYTNAMVFGAAQSLSRLHRAVGNRVRAEHWEKKAAQIRDSVNELLWLPEAGFFRMHLTVSGKDRLPGYDDTMTFALGGNTMAVLYGLASDDQAKRVFAEAEARRRDNGFATVATSLIPPYPSGFFRHPILSDEYAYQNGGQWDWFAGRFVLAEFEAGYSEAGTKHLLQIARRVQSNGGVFEWYSRLGEGRGSEQYAGSAGALAAAVFEGLYGIELKSDGVSIHVRLGASRGAIRVEEPATGRWVSYVYEPGESALNLEFQTNVAVKSIGLLLPEGTRPGEGTRDGEPVELDLVERGADRYAVLSPGGMTGQIVLSLITNE
jgi:GH15 family glucan-1,4-alpha-glucosidase